jgi:hypothetical protein
MVPICIVHGIVGHRVTLFGTSILYLIGLFDILDFVARYI